MPTSPPFFKKGTSSTRRPFFEHNSPPAIKHQPTDRNTSSNIQILYNIQDISNHFNVPDSRPSISRSEIMSQIGHHIYKQLHNSSQNQPNTSNEDGLIKVQFECFCWEY